MRLSIISNEVFVNIPPVEFVKLPDINDPGMLRTIPNSGLIPTVTVCGRRTSLPFSKLTVTSYSPGTIPV